LESDRGKTEREAEKSMRPTMTGVLHPWLTYAFMSWRLDTGAIYSV